MIDPVVFHVAWFMVGLAMMGIPLFFLAKFEALSKNVLLKDIAEGIMSIGAVQLFSVMFGVIVVGAMAEFDPILCVGIGNICTLILLFISSRMD